jgi:hypothetical protein
MSVRRVGHDVSFRSLTTSAQVVEPLDLSLLDREELRLASGVRDRLPGLLQLHLLDPVGGEERNLLSL